jgi:hypothetical protein
MIEGIKARLSAWVAALSLKSSSLQQLSKVHFSDMEKKLGFAEL